MKRVLLVVVSGSMKKVKQRVFEKTVVECTRRNVYVNGYSLAYLVRPFHRHPPNLKGRCIG